MKSTITKLLFTLALFSSAGAALASNEITDRWETLRAINWVENPTNHSRPGRHGELGPYQFRSSTWRMHTSRPFSQAVSRDVSDDVAVKHYEWLKRELSNRGVEATPFNIAMAWNCGVNAVASGRAPNVSYNYAVRVTNLVDVLKERTEAASSPGVEDEGAVAPELEQILNLKLEELEAMPAPPEQIRFRVFPNDAPRLVLAVD
ncbi:hypothetical protein [Oleiharenicola lentus]|uniref:hypothetical protein n=1 Tax=Oleiharenicola lentus TaxID=2508720 RepID=UPI003F666203